MPKFQVKAPDGQLFEFYGPDGATQQQAEEYFRQNYKPSYYKPSQQTPQQPVGLAEEMQKPAYQEQGRLAAGMRSFLNEATLGLGRDAIAGLRAAPALFTEGKDFLPEYERQAAFEKAQLAGGEKEYGTTTALSGLAGGVATSIAATPARVAGWINKSAPFLERAAKYALVSAPVEAFRATQNLQEGETVPQAAQRGLETAAIAGPLGATLEKGVGAVANVGRALVGGSKKGPLTEAEKVIQAGKEANIPIRTTSVFPPQSWAGKKLEAASDIVPLVGTGGGLVKTQEARQKAAEDFVRQYVPEAQSNSAWLQDITTQVKDKHGKMIEKFGKLKNRVLQRPEYNTSADLFDAQTNLSKKARDYQKDISRLEDELNGGQSRGYADLLKEEMDPTYQAMRQGIDVKNWDEFSALLDGATQKMPRTAQPTTLLQRIRQLGGIKKDDYNIGDVKAMDINVRGKTKRQITSEGNLSVTNKPKSLDYMRESLVEEGWLNPKDDINDLLDLMQQDEMARNTGIGHIYKPSDISKGLEYENSLQYDTQISRARDSLYFNYGVDNPEVLKKEIYKSIDKAKKELLKYEAKQGVSRSLSAEEINRLNNDLFQKKSQLNNLSKSIDKLSFQTKSIPTPNLISAIDNELAAIKPSLEAEQITLAEMKAKGKEPSSVGDFAKMEQELLKIRGLASNNKGLNNLEKLREIFSKNFAKDPTAFDFENKLYPYLREDMGNFLKSRSPADYKRWQIGNQELQTLGKEVKKTSLSSIMNKGDIVPESAKNILLSKNASEVEILAKYLNNKGKQSAKSVIVEDMMARSKLKGEDSIDPDKFLESLSQRQNQIKTFFSKQEQDAIEGLKRALQATKRSGKYAKSTPLQMGIGTLGAAGFGSLLPGLTQSLMGVAGAVAVGGRIYQSKAMRDTLVALGRVKQNSTAEQRLIDKLISLQAGQATAREITGE
jgi:hypothetical protein